MLDFLEKSVMNAIGAAAITQKKAEELVAEIKDKYKLSEDEGKQLVDRIQSIVRDSKDKIRELAELEVQKVVDHLGLVSREEYESLLKRVQDLESRFDG
jgi:polyhydroxyalkanoate synthesis regulator phasin